MSVILLGEKSNAWCLLRLHRRTYNLDIRAHRQDGALPKIYMQFTDDELVARCLKELPYRTDAFEQLLHRYEPLVFNTCRRYLRSTEDAEEASQDALLRVFHALPKFRREASFKSWLYRIVTNICATHYARLKSGRERLPRDDAVAVEEVVAEPKADYLEIGGVLGDALDTLKVKDRHILVLRHVAELSFEELAGALDLKLSAAKMRLYRAEQRLTAAYGSFQSQSPKPPEYTQGTSAQECGSQALG